MFVWKTWTKKEMIDPFHYRVREYKILLLFGIIPVWILIKKDDEKK